MKYLASISLLLGSIAFSSSAYSDCEEEANRFARSLGAPSAQLVGTANGLNKFHFTIPGRGICATEFKRHTGTYVGRGACTVDLNWANETKFGSAGQMYNQGYRCPQKPRRRG